MPSGMNYGINSETRSGEVIRRGMCSERWEVKLYEDELQFFAFVHTFKVANSAENYWLEGENVKNILAEIQDYLIVMESTPTGYFVYKDREILTTL